MNTIDYFKELNIKNVCGSFKLPYEKWELYGKNQYNPKIKVSNWWYYRETFPKEYDNKIFGTYKRFGNHKEDESHWITETKDSMANGRGNAALNALKSKVETISIVNILSFPKTLEKRSDLPPEEIKKLLPSLPRDLLTLRYTTTNQASFKKIKVLSNL